MQSTLELRASERAAGRAMLTAIFDWRLFALLGIYIVLVVLFVQLPFSYTFIMGKERGIQSDLPFARSFNPFESSMEMGRWRWSRAESEILVPGIGQRSVLVEMNIISHRAQWQPDAPPTVLDVRLGEAGSTSLTLRQAAASYQFYVPASAMEDGALRLGLETEGWQNPDDQRESLGVAIGEAVTITGIDAAQGFVVPNSDLLLLWSVGLALFWFSLRVLDFSSRLTFWLLLPLAVIVPALLPLTAPRLAFGNTWVVQAGFISLLAAVTCAVNVPPLLKRFAVLPTLPILRWLLLLVVVSFVLKYGGRLYPASMPGDLQLHVNRYTATVLGDIYILAQHRGLPFPFPNGLYLTVAPLTLAGLSIHFLFELVNGLLEASTVLLIYMLVARFSSNTRLALLAAAIYALTAGGHMVSWFAFATQVSAQWFTVLLVAVLVYCWPQRRDWLTWWIAFMLLVQVFLAHIGQFINLALVGLLIVPLLWWRARDAAERAGALWIGGVGLAAGLFVAVFYYTATWGLIWEQITGVLTVGLNEVTEREPLPRSELLWALWEPGLITHFGFFPVLLIIPGALALASPRYRGSILPPLIWLSFLVSLSQAVLPLITLSSITTRWFMFSAWAIAVTSAIAGMMLWRRGRAARVVALAMAGYALWGMIVVWINAMTMRLPPYEPF